MNTRIFREKYKLSQRTFSEYFQMSIRTVENWDSRDNMPEFAFNMCKTHFDLLEVHCDGFEEFLGETIESRVHHYILDQIYCMQHGI